MLTIETSDAVRDGIKDLPAELWGRTIEWIEKLGLLGQM